MFLGIEQQRLIAAKDEAGHGILRPDRADVESADGILAAQKQLLEDRQIQRVGVGMNVGQLAAETQDEAAGLLEVPDTLERRFVEGGVAAETRQVY